MGWGPQGPPDEAYSRVTGAERYAVLGPAAAALVGQLNRRYDVTLADLDPAGALPGRQKVAVVQAVRLTPREGAPLTVAVTDFPGLVLHWGHWSDQRLPDCGCDACDELPDVLLEQLAEVVGDVVGGRTVETLTRRHLELARPQGSSRALLLPAERKAMAAVAPAGRYAWPAWPRREA